jgi:cyclomaltodextrinase / maltogenic alpha-amylase / neopullulanase
MDRFLYIAGGDVNALRMAASIQMQLPGPPIIYYRTEIGLSQTLSKNSQVGLEVSRKAMQWENYTIKSCWLFINPLSRNV